MKYMTMNRFKIHSKYENEYPGIWDESYKNIDSVQGLVDFKLLKLDKELDGDIVVFASCSVWESKEAFEAWKISENYKEMHKSIPLNKHMYAEHPIMEAFEVVLG